MELGEGSIQDKGKFINFCFKLYILIRFQNKNTMEQQIN